MQIAGPRSLNQWYGGFSGFFTYWIDILLTYLVAFNKKSGFKNILFPRSVELDLVLEEQDKVPGFENWQTPSCPGHTNVDLPLYNSEKKIAYIADVFVESQKNVFRPYPISEPIQYKKTLQRYIDLDIQEFMLAHYGRVQVSKERIRAIIDTTSDKPRIHRNTLLGIFMKLVKSLLRKISLPLLLFTSCSTVGSWIGPGFLKDAELTPEEKAVMVFRHKEDAKAYCGRFKYLETLTAHSGTLIQKGTFKSTVNFLKRDAHKLGANGIYIIEHKEDRKSDTATAKAIICMKK